MKSEQLQPSPASTPPAPHIGVPEFNDRYAASIIKGNPTLYEGIEVHGVRNQLEGLSADETQYEIDDRNPQSFSVYLKQTAGGIDCVADCSECDDAVDYARQLCSQYGWPVRNFLLDQGRAPSAAMQLQ